MKMRSDRAGTLRIVRVGPSADPAGLTARARPEARPDWRAANLRARPPTRYHTCAAADDYVGVLRDLINAMGSGRSAYCSLLICYEC